MLLLQHTYVAYATCKESKCSRFAFEVDGQRCLQCQSGDRQTPSNMATKRLTDHETDTPATWYGRDCGPGCPRSQAASRMRSGPDGGIVGFGRDRASLLRVCRQEPVAEGQRPPGFGSRSH